MSIDLVVVGLGYVGLPLARCASRAGLSVAGLDTDSRIVERLADGWSPVRHVTDADVQALAARGFTATADPAVLAEGEAVAVCVPTGLTADGVPDIGPLTAACQTVADHVSKGALVVIESTVFPGATEELVRPILESRGFVVGADIHLGYSPERVDPGNPAFDIANTPKITSGCTELCAKRCAALYERFVDTVVPAAGTREAELAKLLENTYRNVNIALVNEFAVYCHAIGADVWDVVACAATKPFGYQVFRPGPGIGGHCIPVDPEYLLHRVDGKGLGFDLLRAAQRTHAAMPRYVVQRAHALLEARGIPLRGAEVVLLGVTYKPDTDDHRQSPAADIARGLAALGAQVSFNDPHAKDFTLAGIPLSRWADPLQAVCSTDLAILLQGHRDYDLSELARSARLLFDTTGRAVGDRVIRL
jgi:UDP-N-acetyl-D-glucosamine dehydrogenase